MQYDINKNNEPIEVSRFENTLLYKNQNQINVCIDIVTFLHNISNRPEQPYDKTDAARGALIAAIKFTIEDYYLKNKRQFTEEHKKKILEDISSLIDTQLNSLHLAQVLAH